MIESMFSFPREGRLTTILKQHSQGLLQMPAHLVSTNIPISIQIVSFPLDKTMI